MEEIARRVQTRPSPDVSVIVTVMPVPVPVPPAQTSATRTHDPGGVNDAVVAAVPEPRPEPDRAPAGLDPSTVIVPPDAGISQAHQFEWSDAPADPAPYVSALLAVTVPV